MRYVVSIGIALTCSTMLAQTPPTRPQFEVASVRPAAPDQTGSHLSQVMRDFARNDHQPGEIPMTGEDRIRLKDWPLLDLIATAYSVRTTQVSGPAWLDDQIFDIEAKVPAGIPKEQLNAMLESLLEERFGLAAHRATKTGQGFAMIVGKDGPKLKPAAAPPASTKDLTDDERTAQLQQKLQAELAAMRKKTAQNSGRPPGTFNTESWPSITAEELASQLTRLAQAPVVDQTGLNGKYAVTIRTSKDPDGTESTLFDAVERLGLKLEPHKATVETIVVDHVSKTPTAN